MNRSVSLVVASLAIVVAACGAATSTTAPATPTTAPATATAAPESMAPESMAPESMAPSDSADLKDIVATADGAGTFKTLLAAATAAGLVDTLQGDGPFTVFAPTDEAFAALPAGTLDGLLADPEALKKVLLYHVVSGSVTAADVVKLTSADSVEGAPITITVKDGKVYLNDTAQVVATDIMASNGVIHVIDQVILPPSS